MGGTGAYGGFLSFPGSGMQAGDRRRRLLDAVIETSLEVPAVPAAGNVQVTIVQVTIVVGTGRWRRRRGGDPDRATAPPGGRCR